MDADDLTPVAQDYLKVIWSAVEWGEPPITTTALAERFATTKANVSGTMRRLEAQDRAAALETALAALPARQRLAVVLRHFEDRPNPEIAEILGVSVEAVESLLARGRRELAARLAPRRTELGFTDG